MMNRIINITKQYDLLSAGVIAGILSFIFDSMASLYSPIVYAKIAFAIAAVLLLSVGSNENLYLKRSRPEWIWFVHRMRWVFLIFWITMFTLFVIIRYLQFITKLLISI